MCGQKTTRFPVEKKQLSKAPPRKKKGLASFKKKREIKYCPPTVSPGYGTPGKTQGPEKRENL